MEFIPRFSASPNLFYHSQKPPVWYVHFYRKSDEKNPVFQDPLNSYFLFFFGALNGTYTIFYDIIARNTLRYVLTTIVNTGVNQQRAAHTILI